MIQLGWGVLSACTDGAGPHLCPSTGICVQEWPRSPPREPALPGPAGKRRVKGSTGSFPPLSPRRRSPWPRQRFPAGGDVRRAQAQLSPHIPLPAGIRASRAGRGPHSWGTGVTAGPTDPGRGFEPRSVTSAPTAAPRGTPRGFGTEVPSARGDVTPPLSSSDPLPRVPRAPTPPLPRGMGIPVVSLLVAEPSAPSQACCRGSASASPPTQGSSTALPGEGFLREGVWNPSGNTSGCIHCTHPEPRVSPQPGP